MRTTLFRFLARLVTNHNKKVLLFCLFLTVLLLTVAGRLTMKTQIADMMPKGIPQIDEYMDIIDEYKSVMTVMLTIESDTKDISAMKTCAEDLVSRLENITLIKPAHPEKMGLRQKIALMRGTCPIKGVAYDTVQLVERIDFKLDNEFIENSGMIIQKTRDLENMTTMYGSLELPSLIRNINDNFEQEFIDDSENLSSIDGEAQAVQGLEGMRKFITGIGDYITSGDSAKAAETVGSFISGDQYFISPDNTMMLLMLHPAVSMEEFDDAMYLGYRIDDTLSVIQERYPNLALGRSGAMMIQIDENNTLAKDFGWPSLFALLFILLLLIGSFRTWKNPFYSVVTLAIALIWTTGIIAVIIHYINMMSASFSIILIGLGIDFGIHVISGFRDGREQGKSVEDAIYFMFSRSASGIVTGAMTTAIVFFSLWFTRFEAYSQMGMAIGSGILATLFAMLLLLPALIVWDNKGYSITGNLLRKLRLGFVVNAWNSIGSGITSVFRPRIFKIISQPFQFNFLNHAGAFVSKLPVAIVIVVISGVLVFLSVRKFSDISFEYDMMKMEAVGIPSIVCQDNILDKFELSPDFAMVRADNLEDCREKVKKFKKLGKRTGIIGQIDAITEFLPRIAVQKKNIPIIKEFRTTLEQKDVTGNLTTADRDTLARELVRLHQNIAEMGELSVMSSGVNNKIIDKCDQIVGRTDEESGILKLSKVVAATADTAALGRFQKIMGNVMQRKLLTMASTDTVTLENIPESIRERYTNDKSSTLLINVYPKYYIWEESQLRRFNETTGKVTDRITGMPMLMMLMIDLMKSKGAVAITFGTLAIVAFLLIDFRSIRYTVLAMIPLAIGTIWMIGIMAALGMSFTMVSFMALPLIIGIGIDDGVHILHRYRLEGPDSMAMVIKYTGRAILLTSLTTMIGFGSMCLASHRGIAGMGQLLFIGVGTCFITSAFLLPAIITIWDVIAGTTKKRSSNN